MSTLDPVIAELEQFMRKKFEVPEGDPDFTRDVHLFDYGYLDSFGAQEMIAFVEATYQIKVTDNDLVKYPLNTLNEIGQFIIDRQSGTR